MQGTTIHGITVLVMETKPKRTVQKHVEERLASGLCLHCDEQAEKRGCCSKHYQRYRTQLLKLPLDQRAIYTAKQIREGNIAEFRAASNIDQDNPFVESA